MTKVMTKVLLKAEDRIRQGEILRDVRYVKDVTEDGGVLEVTGWTFPLAVVLTQDCDLESDKGRGPAAREKGSNNRVRLLTVMLAPVYNREHIKAGDHLVKIGLKSEPLNGKLMDPIENNQTFRYHCFNFGPEVSIPECCVIDFKHYFTAPVEYIERIRPKNYVCRIDVLFREELSQRFAYFLSRIGIPQEPACTSKSTGALGR